MSIKTLNNIDILHIMPTFYCNYNCLHCSSNSSVNNKNKLSIDEIQKIKKVIFDCNPAEIFFTGGEPTFAVEEINHIIKYVLDLKKVNTLIKITTNGHFLFDGLEVIKKTIGKLLKLNLLRLSIDSFHPKNFSQDQLLLLKKYLDDNKIIFDISYVISSPLDLIKAVEIENILGVHVRTNKLSPCGRAKTNNLIYDLHSFDSSVLNKKCPRLNQLFYLANMGFSFCCSHLAFNKNLEVTKNRFIFENYDDLKNSKAYELIYSHSFIELAKKYNVDILYQPKHSLTCTLCEEIFNNIF